jgi:Raf kinase inhibitor-like YbhB/YbcL family protein
MTSKTLQLAAALATLCLAGVSTAHATAMSVSSSAFTEGAAIPMLHGGNAGDCGGKGVTPQVSWSNLPAGTRSVAVVLTDAEGPKGLGATHWVAYNIDAARGQLKQGEAQADGKGATLGKNVAGATAYRGPCPPVGDLPHHYALTVIASDLAPAALPAGLTRDELLAALNGHALAAQSVVGRYGR